MSKFYSAVVAVKLFLAESPEVLDMVHSRSDIATLVRWGVASIDKYHRGSVALKVAWIATLTAGCWLDTWYGWEFHVPATRDVLAVCRVVRRALKKHKPVHVTVCRTWSGYDMVAFPELYEEDMSHPYSSLKVTL